MTPKQSDLLFNLLVTNLIVWGGLGFLFYGLPFIEERNHAQATVIALSQTRFAPSPTPTQAIPSATLTPPRVSRAIVPTPAQKFSGPIIVATAAPIPPQPIAAAPPPSGSNPSIPSNATNSWQTLNPGTSTWVKLGNGGDHIDASLEANPLDGVTMQVFAPGNLDRPIGQGTYQSSSGRLVWSGGKWNSSGDWMAKITNSNANAVQYKLTATAAAIPPCDSISYWEKIGTADVYWTRCK